MNFKTLKINLSEILLVNYCLALLLFSCNPKAKETDVQKTDETKTAIVPREDSGSVDGMVWIEGGEFIMGTDADDVYPAEKPAVKNKVAGFWMDETEVTNQQYKEF